MISLKKLKIKNAYISFKWRNNKKIWKFTKNKPSKKITLNQELKWIKSVLEKKDQKRYGIYINEPKAYIGNLYFTNIKNKNAEFHIFIGDQKYWGKGYGLFASQKAIIKGFHQLKLNQIYLFVHKKNQIARKIYEKLGFQYVKTINRQHFLKMVIKKTNEKK